MKNTYNERKLYLKKNNLENITPLNNDIYQTMWNILQNSMILKFHVQLKY